jgi:hypothetical protein
MTDIPPQTAAHTVWPSAKDDASEWSAIEQLLDRLTQSHPEIPGATVGHHNHARFDGCPVRDFVPLFVERGARQELGQLDSLRAVQ